MTLTIFLPAYNEAKVIGDVLDGLPRTLSGITKINVLVVDDGSADETAVIARQHGALVVRHPLNRGVGLATITGMEVARRLQTDYLVMLDSDGQHDSQDLPKILAPLLTGKADVVVGTRLLSPKGMPLIRRLGNKTMNFLLKVISGVQTTDSQSGFRAFNRSALEQLRLSTSGYEIHTEILVAARSVNLRVAEVPIKVIYTSYSKRKGQTITNALNVIIRLVVRAIVG